MNAILPLDEIDGTEDCKTHGSAFITFGGKWMMCPDCAAAELARLTEDLTYLKDELAEAERERDELKSKAERQSQYLGEIGKHLSHRPYSITAIEYEEIVDGVDSNLAAALKAGE